MNLNKLRFASVVTESLSTHFAKYSETTGYEVDDSISRDQTSNQFMFYMRNSESASSCKSKNKMANQ